MATATRLVTFIDVAGHAASKTQMDVSARLEAEISDGRRVILLDDRGWGSSINRTTATVPDIWLTKSLDNIRETACTVVGPDEPPDGRSYDDEDAAHWASLQQILQRQGVTVAAAALKQLPHDVVPSARLLARIGHAASQPRSG